MKALTASCQLKLTSFLELCIFSADSYTILISGQLGYKKFLIICAKMITENEQLFLFHEIFFSIVLLHMLNFQKSSSQY